MTSNDYDVNDYDVPLWKCQTRGCPVTFTASIQRKRHCAMHLDQDQTLTRQRREYLDECADLITRAPSEVRQTGRVVRG